MRLKIILFNLSIIIFLICLIYLYIYVNYKYEGFIDSYQTLRDRGEVFRAEGERKDPITEKTTVSNALNESDTIAKINPKMDELEKIGFDEATAISARVVPYFNVSRATNNKPPIDDGYYWIDFNDKDNLTAALTSYAGATLNTIPNSKDQYLLYNSSGSLILRENYVCDILVVGGGGAGAQIIGGGGGAGGVVYQTDVTLKAGIYDIIIGEGGLAATTINLDNNVGQNGKDSYISYNNADLVINNIIYRGRGGGGGGGGYSRRGVPGVSGGSGGGGGNGGDGATKAGGAATQGNTISYSINVSDSATTSIQYPSISGLTPRNWYKFDDPTNIGFDSGSMPINLSIINMPPSIDTTNFVNGTSSIQTVRNTVTPNYLKGVVNLTAPFSICLWFYMNSDDSHAPFGIGNDSLTPAITCQFATSNRKLGTYVAAPSVWNPVLMANTEITPFKWYHYVLTVTDDNPAVVSVYINGVLDISGRGSGALTRSANKNLYIGMRGDLHASMPFGGNIDDFRIYNTVLTATQVSELYKSTTDRKYSILNNANRGGTNNQITVKSPGGYAGSFNYAAKLYYTGGGGGAGGTSRNMDGGPGVEINITGENKWYAGGGGGGTIAVYNNSSTTEAGMGGSGIGGDGCYCRDIPGNYTYPTRRHGVANTGSGGGAYDYTYISPRHAQNPFGGNGGSGVVIIRFKERASLGKKYLYCLMNKNYFGGGWMLAMRAVRGSITFGYISEHWTNATTLNDTIEKIRDSSVNADMSISSIGDAIFNNYEGNTTAINRYDAKFDIFNRYKANEWMAIFYFKDNNGVILKGGDIISGGNQSAKGWVWRETNLLEADNIERTPLQLFQKRNRMFRNNSLIDLRGNYGVKNVKELDKFKPVANMPRLWSSQHGYNFYGINYDVPEVYENRGDGRGASTRWGFAWNENWDYANNNLTNDVYCGIGLRYPGSGRPGYSAGDFIYCCEDGKGVNSSIAFEWYVR